MKISRFSRPFSSAPRPAPAHRPPAHAHASSYFVRRASAMPAVFDPALICGPGSTRISPAEWRAPGRSPYPVNGDFFLTQDELCIGPWHKPPVIFQQVNGVTKDIPPDFEFPIANLARVRVQHDSPFLINRGTPDEYMPMLPLLEQACQFQLPMFDRFPSADNVRRLTIFFERWENIRGAMTVRPGDLLQVAARLVPDRTIFKQHVTTGHYRVDATLQIDVTLVERNGTAACAPVLSGMGIINGTTESRDMPRNIFAVTNADFKSALDTLLANGAASDLHATGEYIKAGRFNAGNMAYAGYDTLVNAPDGIIGVRHLNEQWPVFDYHFGGNVRLTPGIVLADLVLQRMALEPFITPPDGQPLDVTAFGNYRLRSLHQGKFEIPCLPGSLVGIKLVNPQTRRQGDHLIVTADKGQVLISRRTSDIFSGKGRTSAEFENVEIEMPFIPRCAD